MKKSKTKPKAAAALPFSITEDYKILVCSQSYLGKKGYTVPKSVLSIQDIEQVKKELLVKPEVFGANYGGGGKGDSTEFPVYRESDKKIYIPRFYGIKRYGLPTKSEIQTGDDIDVSFTKTLRDYQVNIVDIYRKYVDMPICSGSHNHGSGGILEVPCGRGKCLAKDTPVLMFDGTIKNVQDVVIGDKLMGDDSTGRTVISLANGQEMMYKIKEVNGYENEYIVNESHILSLKTIYDHDIVDISVAQYINLINYCPKIADELNGYRVAVDFERELILDKDPYMIGHQLSELDEFIPKPYLINSYKNRLELLLGIIDSNGLYETSSVNITIKNPSLLKDVIFLIRSLGMVFINKGDELTIYGSNHTIENFPIKLPYHSLKYEFTIEKLDVDNYYGFEIDGNRRFVLGDLTVTHNTIMALKIISELKKKTLIIVHKEFLMNQWIERIEEFLPGARVGKIQAQVFDIENRDIVIGMVQTLYDKDFGAGTFDSFGLTIIDEVHRIGSEQFSKTLFKTITPYMLGISATVDRKDKLTRVLYMFIGDKIYEEKRENDDAVCVRAIEYKSIDPQFNEVETDFRGNTKYSTMISKLCEFGPRSDFIVRVIRDLRDEDCDGQIMVLCHNRNLLTYLFDAIRYRNFATVGFYVGGMKQPDLQETESKNIVLATYAMAAEALDIKTLSTLVMVTPKTDITQSVGRILRVKHENPIIVDIVDSHDVFQNQWIQRRRFYKKCNYRIRQIDSIKYTNMSIDWQSDITWKRVFEPKSGTTNAEVFDSEETILPFGGKCLLDINFD